MRALHVASVPMSMRLTDPSRLSALSTAKAGEGDTRCDGGTSVTHREMLLSQGAIGPST